MNESQSAHGNGEHGYMVTHVDIERRVIVGHWSDEKMIGRAAGWMRTAVGIMESSHVRAMRFTDNMRNVAVTEGSKVEAQVRLGWEMDAYSVNELYQCVKAAPEGDIIVLTDEHYGKYIILLKGRDPEEFRRHMVVQVQIEAGLERFPVEKDYHAIVIHFGNLGELQQPPGLVIQRPMERGYGFGGEGDWKTAAMIRLTKIMVQGVKNAKSTSFIEGYTYNSVPGKERTLEAHMLGVYPSIANGEISIKVNSLSMGDKEDPAKLVFTSKTEHSTATSLMGLGIRFRLIINDMECRKTEKAMPKLLVVTTFWTPESSLATNAEAWTLAGGAHHTVFSYDSTTEQMGDWAESMGIEVVYVDKDTIIRGLKNGMCWNGAVYG